MSLEKVDPVVEIEILGQVRKVEFSFYAVAQFKRLTGINILQGGIGEVDAENLISLVWAGLVKHNPELDVTIRKGDAQPAKLEEILRNIGNELTISRAPEIGDLIQKAILLATPAAEQNSEAEEKNDQTQAINS